MFYVIPSDATEFKIGMFSKSFTNFREACEYADKRKHEVGYHYTVHEVRSLYTTQTLAEAMKQEEEAGA